jgi:hypothetical protein
VKTIAGQMGLDALMEPEHAEIVSAFQRNETNEPVLVLQVLNTCVTLGLQIMHVCVMPEWALTRGSPGVAEQDPGGGHQAGGGCL